MATTEIVCPHCGRHNSASARMCGSCGRPLPVAGKARSRATASYPPGEEPTEPDIQAQGGYGQGIRLGGAQSPSVGGCLGRGAIVLGFLALVLVCGCAALWGIVLEPQLHNSVDGQIRGQLQTAIGQANQQLPTLATQLDQLPGKQGRQDVTSASLNQAIAGNIPDGSPVKNVQVGLGNGQVTLTFTTYGLSGTVSTHITAQDGKPHATGTVVDGPLSFVESASDVENALNDSFAGLSSDVTFTDISIGQDTMSVTVQSAK